MTKKEYRFEAETGDVVELEDGTLGVISSRDFDCGGNCMIVKVFPFAGLFARFIGAFREKYVFYDEQIDALKKVGSLRD